MILGAVLGSCVEEAEAYEGSEESCKEGIADAKRAAENGNYSVTIPGMPAHLSPYAEEIIYKYYGRKIDVRNTDMWICGTGVDFERKRCRDHYMDSIAGTFGISFQRVVVGADSLYGVHPKRYPHDFITNPEFPGGNEALQRQLKKNIAYPVSARQDSVQGKVWVRVALDTTGQVVNAIVIKGVRADLDSAAVVGIRKLPNFTPTYSYGVKIKAETVIPIAFKLD